MKDVLWVVWVRHRKAYPDSPPWEDWEPSGQPYTSRSKAKEAAKALRMTFPYHRYKVVTYDRRKAV